MTLLGQILLDKYWSNDHNDHVNSDRIALRRGGAPRKLTPESEICLVQDYLQGKLKTRAIAEKYGVSRQSVSVILKRWSEQKPATPPDATESADTPPAASDDPCV
jgi:transposase-like protein